jgi:hypothetical protein
MTRQTPQAKDETEGPTLERDELTNEQLEDVKGGAGFLSGSLTTHQDATPWLNTDGGNANGFIMRDSVIVRTGR